MRPNKELSSIYGTPFATDLEKIVECETVVRKMDNPGSDQSRAHPLVIDCESTHLPVLHPKQRDGTWWHELTRACQV